jgi:hypothetical protein
MKLINVLIVLVVVLLFFRYAYKIRENFECKTIVNYNNKKCPPPFNNEINFWLHDKRSNKHKCNFKKGNILFQSPDECCFYKNKNIIINDKCHRMNKDQIDLNTCLVDSPMSGCGLCTDSNGNGTYVEGTPTGPFNKHLNCIPSKPVLNKNNKVSHNAWFMCNQNKFIR